MANIADIRNTVQSYISDHFVTSLTVQAIAGSSINVGEQFKIEITVANNATQSDVNPQAAVPVANVVCHVETLNPSLAKLIVPSGIKATGLPATGPVRVGVGEVVLTPGTEVNKMSLHPVVFGGSKPLRLDASKSATLKFNAIAKAKGEAKIRTMFSGDIEVLPPSSKAGKTDKAVTIAE